MPGTRLRIAIRASGGGPKKSLKKARCLLLGSAREMLQAVISPLSVTRKGRFSLGVRAWKPVTLPIARQGSCGQEGGGSGPAPSTSVVLPARAPAPEASASRRQAQARATDARQRGRRAAAARRLCR